MVDPTGLVPAIQEQVIRMLVAGPRADRPEALQRLLLANEEQGRKAGSPKSREAGVTENTAKDRF